jgi:tyramine---L-glutamate ligase
VIGRAKPHASRGAGRQICGLLADSDGSEDRSLRREGAAMLAALAADFAAIDGMATTLILDSRQDTGAPSWRRCRIVPVRKPGEDCDALAECCRDVDWTVVIAPEFDGLLEARACVVQPAGGRLLGPSPRLIALAADKQRTAEHLAAARVPVAFGEVVDAGNLLTVAAAIGYPAVLKPRDGAGSKNVRLIADRAAAEKIHESDFEQGRLERFYPGVAASVAVLCGPSGLFPLPACRQRLSDDGQFRYLGGSCPLEPGLGQRAASIAMQAIRSLANPLGYVGVDLVLGADPNGQDDVVIEINPRLTTSYVGLRAIASGNLAAAMMAIAEGGAPVLSFGGSAVDFDADGTVRRLHQPRAIGS